MAASNFERALGLVLRHEGGWANHPRDPGGATMRGVTQRTYDAWRRSRRSETRSVRFIAADEICAIYRAGYWNTVRGDDLPPGLDYATFDFAVNSGPVRAVRALQRALDVAVDGHIGPITLRAAQTADVESVIDTLCDDRTSWLRSLSTWLHFGAGWNARVNGRTKHGRLIERGVRQHAIAMSEAAHARA